MTNSAPSTCIAAVPRWRWYSGRRVVEVGEVAVVDDPCASVSENQTRKRRVLERRPAVGDAAELERVVQMGHVRRG